MSMNVRSPRSSSVSIESRVVPGTSETIVRSAPIKALKSDDLPTFGRPRIATRIASSPGERRAGAVLFELGDDEVEQVAGAVAVQAGERKRLAESEPVELERERLLRGIVDLVRDHDHRLVRQAEDLRELLVARRDPCPRVDDEEHEIGLGDRGARLLGDRACDRVLRGDVDAAGVDQQEALAVPLAHELLAVAGRAVRLVHDRGARRGEAVDERRLADVREADDRHRAEQLFAHSGGVSPGGRPRAWTSASQSKSTLIRRSISRLASL